MDAPDLAIAIGEHAFRSGWEAMRASLKSEANADFALREDLLQASWGAYTPSEAVCGEDFGNVTALREAVNKARVQFAFYADQHAAKVPATDDTMAKAKVNRQFVALMEQALDGAEMLTETPVIIPLDGGPIVEQPEPNAPAPEVMRLELVNIVYAKIGSHASRHKAEQIVDAVLEKQMIYYASMADPEVTTDEMARVAAVVEAKAVIETLIRQGAAVCDYMADKSLWQRIATRGRAVVAKLEALIV
jgi:hypothetical protein